MTHYSRRPRGGFASVTAVALIGLVATALATMASLFAVEMRRTTEQSADAQLRQLLTAGAMAAPAHLNDDATARTLKIALPEDLAAAGATLELHVTANEKIDGVVLIRVDANLGGVRGNQLLTFSRDGGKWELVSAILDREVRNLIIKSVSDLSLLQE